MVLVGQCLRMLLDGIREYYLPLPNHNAGHDPQYELYL